MKSTRITLSKGQTTAAVPTGHCATCGWQLFEDLKHHCPTGVRPLVTFNVIGTSRVHSSGGYNDNERHRIDERYF